MKLCNCALCEVVLLGESMRGVEIAGGQPDHEYVAGRIHDRPYCEECLEVRQPTALPATMEDDSGPWQQNAIRDMEE